MEHTRPLRSDSTPLALIQARKGRVDVMKINQFGMLMIAGVVISMTAACGGSPTKASAIPPAFGDGSSAASVNVTAPRLALVPCSDQPAPEQSGEDGGNAETPVAMCDAPVPADSSADADASAGAEPEADAAQGEVVMDTAMPTDDARFFARFSR